MAQVSLPYNLQAGQPENVNQLMQNLDALVAGVNSVNSAQIDSGAVGTTELASGAVTQAKAADGIFVPIGAIMQYGGSSAPTNWLLCDGTPVSRTTYSSLFSAIGTAYGAGDGSTTFALPNLKGKVPVGYDSTQTEFDALGETGGAKTHTLTSSELAAHNHGPGTLGTNTTGDHFHGVTDVFRTVNATPMGYTGTATTGYQYDFGAFTSTDGDHSHTVTTGTTANTGGGGAHNNLQPYVVFNYIIRAL